MLSTAKGKGQILLARFFTSTFIPSLLTFSPMSATHKNLVLIGPMGSGKSSIGQSLAASLHFSFTDTDSLITTSLQSPIPQIFAEHGEPFFRKTESAILASLSPISHSVISTGGGIILLPENRPLLQNLGFVIFLTASDDTLFSRVSRNQNRPLLQTENPRATMAAITAARFPLYSATAHFTLDTTSLSRTRTLSILLAEAQRALALTPPNP